MVKETNEYPVSITRQLEIKRVLNDNIYDNCTVGGYLKAQGDTFKAIDKLLNQENIAAAVDAIGKMDNLLIEGARAQLTILPVKPIRWGAVFQADTDEIGEKIKNFKGNPHAILKTIMGTRGVGDAIESLEALAGNYDGENENIPRDVLLNWMFSHGIL